MNLRKGEPTGDNKVAWHIEGGKQGGNRRGQSRKKQAHSVGLQGPRGTRVNRSRAERRRSAGTGGGGRQEGEMSRFTVDLSIFLVSGKKCSKNLSISNSFLMLEL